MNTKPLAISCVVSPRSRARLLAALSLSSLMLVASVKADTSLWTGSVNGNWNTTDANWTNAGSGIYTTGDAVQFGDTGGANLTISVVSAVSPASVSFTDTGSGTNAYTFNTSAINGTGTTLSLASGFGGTVRFNVANGYTGATTLAGGTVQVGVSNALGATSSVLNLSGGSLQSIGGALRTLANSSIVATTATNTSLAAAAGDLTLSGALTGSGTISVNNSAAGTVWLSGNLSGYTGTINYNNVNNGNNFFISGGADLSQAKVVLTGATVSTRRFGLGSNGSASIGELSGTGGTIGAANNNSGVYSIGALNTDSSFGGIFVNVGSTGITSVTKVGTGTLTLSGASTNTGTFTINAGTLKFGANNVLAGGSSIALGGGTLNLGGFTSNVFTTALSMSSSSTIDFGTHVGALTLKFADSHLATWTGNLTLLNFVVGTDNLSFTSVGGLSVGQLSQIALAGYTATGLDGSGNVQFSAIPEPSTYAALAGMAMLGLAVVRRRKR